MATLRHDGVELYYEVHGEGEPLLAMGGWGTFCHGGLGELPRSVLSRYQVVAFDWRGIVESTDDLSRPLTMQLLANDAAALLDHLGLSAARVMGIIGMGGCVAQELALARPDLVRAMLLTGCWAKVDTLFGDHLDLLHETFAAGGFAMYQKFAASLSFTAEFYAANRDRVLGPQGAWKHLQGRPELVRRLVDLCRSHDAIERLGDITVPTMVIHGGMDVLTPARLTREISSLIPGAESVEWPELAHVPAGRDQRARFDDLVSDFFARC